MRAEWGPECRASNRIGKFIARLVSEDAGQDAIEYALLTGAIGLAGAAALESIRDAVGFSYTTWDTSVQGLWQPPAPSGS